MTAWDRWDTCRRCARRTFRTCNDCAMRCGSGMTRSLHGDGARFGRTSSIVAHENGCVRLHHAIAGFVILSVIHRDIAALRASHHGVIWADMAKEGRNQWSNITISAYERTHIHTHTYTHIHTY